MSDRLQLRQHGDPALPALVYLPGLHGDWTLIGAFRRAVEGRVHFVELSYPSSSAWRLRDYAREILAELAARGIARGWLLAESFGSQVAWAMLQERGKTAATGTPGFMADGLILAGGFVRHPFMGGVKLAGRFCSRSTPWFLRLFLWAYPRYARVRHWRMPETLRDIREFVARRQAPGDREAMSRRLGLIAAADFRGYARTVQLPVFCLTGFWDPIVFWWPVRTWLRRQCPGLQAGRILFWAEHAVLATQPNASAQQVLTWMGLTGR